MKAVILAAGKGTRMGDLTQNTPKPLLKYRNKNLLEHKFEKLPLNTTEIILVIGYLGEKIKEYFGDSYNDVPIRYVVQTEMLGTAHALWQCKEYLHEPFMVLMSDDLYSETDLDNMAQRPDGSWAVLAYPEKPGTKAGKIVKDEAGDLKEIIEDFEGTTEYNLIYTGVCLLTEQIFSRDMVQLSNGEYGLPQTIAQFVDSKRIKVLETNTWTRITSPEDLE